MKALFLDDERWRHDLFEQRMRGTYVVHHAYTLNQFKALVAAHVFHLVSFDFDLVEPEFDQATSASSITLTMKPPPYCGLDCVNAMLSQPPDRWPPRVVVHSWNSRGAGAMMARLREAGLDPVREQFESKQATASREAEDRFRARCEKEVAHPEAATDRRESKEATCED